MRSVSYLVWGLLLLCLILIMGPAAGSNAPSGVEQRGQDVALMSIYTQREKALAAELLALDLQLDDLLKQQAVITQRLRVLERDSLAARRALVLAEERLAISRKRLGRWLCYLYENGRLTILNILLDASNFNDLLRRAELVSWMADYEAGILREVRGRRDVVSAALVETQALGQESREQEKVLAARITDTKRLQGQKAAMLDALQVESTDLACRITALEEQWYASLTPLHSLIGRMDQLFIKELRPDRIYFAGRHMRMDVSESTINAALGRMDVGDGSALRVRLSTEGITVAGVSEGTTSFSLTGSLVPDRGGRAVRFKPVSLTLDGVPVQPDVLRNITQEGGLFFALGRQAPMFAVRSITTGDDRVTIALAPR